MSATSADAFNSAARQVGDEGIEFGPVAPDHDDMGAEPREQPGDRAADAAGAACDHHDLILQRIGRVHRRMRRKFRVGQWGCVGLIIHLWCRPLSRQAVALQ